MNILSYLSIAAAIYCICSLAVHFIRIIRLGKPKDLSQKSGDVTKGVVYANTVAMMPQNKESAYLHLPSYATGMLFHVGTFLSMLIWLLTFFPFFNRWMSNGCGWNYILAAVIAITCICGYLLLVKRIFSKDLKVMSNPDDYLSNFLTSTFQLATVLYLATCALPVAAVIYYVVCIVLFLYLPLGKLRHLLYYFSARYHLGFFYGWRNVWPKNEQ